MPKHKTFYIDLPKLITRDAIDKLMFGYVLGYRFRNVLPVITVRKAITEFTKEFGLNEDTYPMDSAVVTFYNMFKEYKKFKL